MRWLEIILEPKSNVLTPWQADTLFGHMAWEMRYEHGEKVLREWLDSFALPLDEEAKASFMPPFVLSDGFATGWLPRPMLPPPIRNTVITLEDARQAKTSKNLRWLSTEAWQQGNYNDRSSLSKQGEWRIRVSMHNIIDRHTMQTLEEGGFFASEEYVLPVDLNTEEAQTVSIFAAIRSQSDGQQLVSLLERIALIGYGKRKSVGFGQFNISAVHDRTDWWTKWIEQANAHMWLSHGVPSRYDCTHGWYRIRTKHGKIGEGWSELQNPFKKPLTRIVPGSVFKNPKGSYQSYAGCMIDRISEYRPEIVQYAYALTLPLVIEESSYEEGSILFTGRI